MFNSIFKYTLEFIKRVFRVVSYILSTVSAFFITYYIIHYSDTTINSCLLIQLFLFVDFCDKHIPAESQLLFEKFLEKAKTRIYIVLFFIIFIT